MNLLLVDDEAPALAKLRRFLADDPGVRIAGEACDGDAALAFVAADPDAVDAVLLDIQMPGRSGLAVAAALPPHVLVAFATAYDAHAVQAFELNAVDYLLKPFTRERLAACVGRLRDRLAPPERAQQRQRLATALHALQPVAGHWLVADRGELRRVPLAEIECVAAADNYIELHSATSTWLDRTTLAAFLAQPAAARFVRVHRSCAVQPACVAALEPLGSGDAQLRLVSGRVIRLSRRYRDEWMRALGR
ncbi:MAG TPA: LytTR family DNA-binding domain-containing protein [Burkholderiaceae bacterium]